MEELIPKLLEYGVLGVICIILLLKGIPALNELTKSVSALAAIIGKLSDKVNQIETRFDKLENRIDSGFKDIRDVLERRLQP